MALRIEQNLSVGFARGAVIGEKVTARAISRTDLAL